MFDFNQLLFIVSLRINIKLTSSRSIPSLFLRRWTPLISNEKNCLESLSIIHVKELQKELQSKADTWNFKLLYEKVSFLVHANILKWILFIKWHFRNLPPIELNNILDCFEKNFTKSYLLQIVFQTERWIDWIFQEHYRQFSLWWRIIGVVFDPNELLPSR